MIKRRRRVARLAIVAFFIVDDDWQYGFDVVRRSGLGSARGYIALHELEQFGALQSRFVDRPYPRKREYRLNAEYLSQIMEE